MSVSGTGRSVEVIRESHFTRPRLVSSHATAAAGFAELERIARRIAHFGLPGNAIESFVVDEQRRQLTVDG